MGFVEFFSKKGSGRRKNHRRRDHRVDDYSDESKTDRIENDYDHALSEDELYELPASSLRQRCRKLGIDSSRALQKSDLVNLLFNHFQRNVESLTGNANYGGNTLRTSIKNDFGSPPPSMSKPDHQSLIKTVQEIIPYFGKDSQMDDVVIDTLDKLPVQTLDTRDANGNTLLMLSCQANAYNLVSILLQRGSDPNATNNFGETCLHFTAYTDSYSPETANLLVRHGANAQMTEQRFGCSPLHYAASLGGVELCRTLMNGGANPSSTDFNGCSAIDYAVQSNVPACANFLLERSNQTFMTGESKDNFDDVSEWEELVDYQSGMKYYHCKNTGKSLWMDEYELYQQSKQQQNRKESIALLETKRHDSFRDAPPCVEIDIEETQPKGTHSRKDEVEHSMSDEFVYVTPKKQSLNQRRNTKRSNKPSQSKFASIDDQSQQLLQDMISDSSSSTSTVKEDVSKDLDELSGDKVPSVNNRKLVSEKSFNQRLDSMQQQILEALQVQQRETLQKKENDSQNIKPHNENHNLLEISVKQKDEENLELRSRLKNLEAALGESEIMNQLASYDKVTLQRIDYAKQSVDTGTCTNICTQDAAQGDQDVNKIWIAEKDYNDIKRLLDKTEYQLKESKSSITNLENMQGRSREQINVLEGLLQEEKDAKIESIVLLEQVRAGIASEEDILQTLKEEKERSEANVKHLQQSLQGLEDEKRQLQSKNEEEQMLLQDKEEFVQQLQKKMEEMDASFHLQQEKTAKKHHDEIQALHSKYSARIQKLERIAEEKTQERDNAVQERELAFDQLSQMQKLIEEAKTLFASNERLHKSLHLEIEKRKSLHNKLEDIKGKIRVYVRLRPLSSSELERNCKEALTREDKRTCVLNSSGVQKEWEFDKVSPSFESQESFFEDARQLVCSAVDGFNVSIFCYGQTGSGKTYTMMGPSGEIPNVFSAKDLDKNSGLAPRAVVELFQILETRTSSFDSTLSVSMLELYNDNLRDLIVLSEAKPQRNLRIRLAEHSESKLVEVEGAESIECRHAPEVLALIGKASKSRSTASTKMNADSSRSHLIISIVVKLTNKRTGVVTSGKLTLVDLAGSERVSKSGATGVALKEAQNINKSLSAIGDVINALTSGNRGHVPYRNHPLTMLLSDSLGGSAKTLMVVNISPADYNANESTNSLDFAKRCKRIQNKVDGSSRLKALQKELARLKKGGKGSSRVANPRRPGE